MKEDSKKPDNMKVLWHPLHLGLFLTILPDCQRIVNRFIHLFTVAVLTEKRFKTFNAISS